MKTLLVIDDEPQILIALQAYFENVGYRVITATSGVIALDVFHNHLSNNVTIDLILLDLMLPQLSGEAVCKKIREKSQVPIIMLTAKTLEAEVIAGLNLGADDYVTKPFRLKELHARIEAILRRMPLVDLSPTPSYLTSIDGKLLVDISKHDVRKSGIPIYLTTLEIKLLSTLMQYPHKVFTREELIALVLGADYEGYDRTIDSHIKNIRMKLEDDTKKPQYIVTVHGIGYKFG
jgi:DNA-binding response OmpR family regulator